MSHSPGVPTSRAALCLTGETISQVRQAATSAGAARGTRGRGPWCGNRGDAGEPRTGWTLPAETPLRGRVLREKGVGRLGRRMGLLVSCGLLLGRCGLLLGGRGFLRRGLLLVVLVRHGLLRVR